MKTTTLLCLAVTLLVIPSAGAGTYSVLYVMGEQFGRRFVRLWLSDL